MEGFEETIELARALCHFIGHPNGLAVMDQFEETAPGSPVAPPEPAYSRREFFRAFKRQAVIAVADTLPAPPSPPAPVSEWRAAQNPRRAYLLELLARFPTTVPTSITADDFPFATLRVNDNCMGCNVCEALCPTGALRREESEESFALRFAPAKCVNCGVCAKACYTRAIRLQAAVDLKAVLSEGEEEVIRFAKRRCEICGQSSVRRGESLCFACLKRRRLLNRVFGQSGGIN
jgi:formate hydrogenlyase subunit 6/NADH:ubiquinone oxidoreductase subunit I